MNRSIHGLRSIMDRYAKLTGTPVTAGFNKRTPGSSDTARSDNRLVNTVSREVPDSAKLPLIPLNREGGSEDGKRSLRISLLGLPNAGKSSLMNALIRAPVAAVSPKSHTTRELVQGINTSGNFQLIVDDLPGLIAVRQSQEVRKFVYDAWTSADLGDQKILVVDVTRRVDPGLVQVLRSVGSFKDVVLVLNKVDLLEPNASHLRLKRKELEEYSVDGSAFMRVFFISAKKGHGLSRLMDFLKTQGVQKPWLYPSQPAKVVTSLSRVDQVEQQTRCFIYTWFNKDLPYKLRATVVAWDERLDGSLAIEQELRVKDTVVARMVLGVRNRLIRNLQDKLSERLTKLWGVNVTMRVLVRAEKVRESKRDRMEKARAGIESADFRL